MHPKILLAPLLTTALVLSACTGSTSAPAPSDPAGEAAPAAAIKNFDLLDKANGVYSGKGASSGKLPVAYILFDPQCPHCADLWHNAKPLQDEVLVKWIPVGILNRNSVIQSAMLLEAADPVGLLTRNEDEYAATRRPSNSTADVKTDTLHLVEQNTSLLDTLQVKSVPAIVYRDRLTHGPAIVLGAKSTEKLAELFGVARPTSVAN